MGRFHSFNSPRTLLTEQLLLGYVTSGLTFTPSPYSTECVTSADHGNMGGRCAHL